MEINGVAHVMLTVSNFEACQPFYEKLLGFLGLRPVINADGILYCVGGRTAMGIQRGDASHSTTKGAAVSQDSGGPQTTMIPAAQESATPPAMRR